MSCAEPYLRWWFSDQTQAIYKQIDSGWKDWTQHTATNRITRRSTNRFASTNIIIPCRQQSWRPITVSHFEESVIRTGRGQLQHEMNDIPEIYDAWKSQG